MLEKLLFALNDFAWAYSLSTNKYVFISPNIHLLTGLNVEQFSADAESLLKIVVAEDQQQLVNSINNLNLEDQAELHYRIKVNGKTKWLFEKRSRFIDWASNNEIVLSVVKDVSDQNVVKHYLNTALGDFSILFDKNLSPMWIYETPSLRILKVNHAATEQYGYTTKEFLSMTIRDIRPKLDLAAFNDYIFRKGIIKNKIKGHNNSGIWKHLNKNGDVIYAEVTGHEIKYNNTSCRIVVINDVSERVLFEQERDRVESQQSAG